MSMSACEGSPTWSCANVSNLATGPLSVRSVHGHVTDSNRRLSPHTISRPESYPLPRHPLLSRLARFTPYFVVAHSGATPHFHLSTHLGRRDTLNIVIHYAFKNFQHTRLQSCAHRSLLQPM